MSPTRELAQQIDQATQGFSYYLDDISGVPVYGGNDGNRYDQELKAMRSGADILIATPGRLISHLQMGNLDLSHCSFFVLDEADRMLDMGFSEDIKLIAKELPETCQTIMFSATMPDKIEDLAKSLLHNHVEVKIAVSKPAEKIRQSAYVCYEPQKLSIIEHLFKQDGIDRVIVFSGKKTKVKDIATKLKRMNVNCGAMHSDLSQAERDEIMLRFKSGNINVLVATDIVARGIDIDDITTVINYDVPHDAEDYVHRIGRTARAQRDGSAITLVSEEEIYLFKLIEKFLGHEVAKAPLPAGCKEGPDYATAGRRTGNSGRQGGKGGHARNRQRRQTNRKQGNGKKSNGKPQDAKRVATALPDNKKKHASAKSQKRHEQHK